MTDTKQQIAKKLYYLFIGTGFATQGVEALRAEADVSLRTLYKYYPSREAMIIGALEYREGLYWDWIEEGPENGVDHLLYPLVRLGDWLEQVGNTGCLFMNALSTYPESEAIRKAVEAHKERLRNVFVRRLETVAPDCEVGALADRLFLLHEGLTDVARLRGVQTSTAAALEAARALLAREGIH
ncbi:TetR/AcrR family transcriptional regulator [Kiloniella sp. b19]|uniref:TetR/AcrR family transcriptional regulator n=1 Tax=Kiloniella sp. GXU_MW_B19 TaxID=3141326 RepID=UPI0031E48EA6